MNGLSDVKPSGQERVARSRESLRTAMLPKPSALTGRPAAGLLGNASDLAASATPVTLAAVAVGGAALLWLKPWKWLLRPRLLASLVVPVSLFALKRVPLRIWLKLGAKAAQKAGQASKARATTARLHSPR